MAIRGIDLLDFYRGSLSIRRLRILIESLPRESATKTALRNAIPDEDLQKVSAEGRPDQAAWSDVAVWLAIIRDELVMSRSVAIAAAGAKPPAFVPTSRPGVPPKSTAPKRLSDEDRRAIDPPLSPQS